MVDETYIKLYRKVLDNELFIMMPYDQWHAYEYLLLRAARFPVDVLSRGKIVKLQPGQLIVGEGKLAEAWGWSRGKVRRFFSRLEELQMVQVHGTPVGTILTVENYKKYQCADAEGRPSIRTSDGTADETTAKSGQKSGHKSEPQTVHVRGQVRKAAASVENSELHTCTIEDKKPQIRPHIETSNGTSNGTQIKKEKEYLLNKYTQGGVDYRTSLQGQSGASDPPHSEGKKKFFNKLPPDELDAIEERVRSRFSGQSEESDGAAGDIPDGAEVLRRLQGMRENTKAVNAKWERQRAQGEKGATR